MKFEYVATTAAGQLQRGTLEAPSRKAVTDVLDAQRLIPITVVAAATHKHLVTGGMTWQFGKGGVSYIERVTFCRHLAIMLKAGLSIVESLNVILDQTSNKKYRRVLAGVIKDVTDGKSLADSLNGYPRIFSGLILGMVKIGEASGTLEKNLDYAANELEKDFELRRKVQTAMLYPVIVLSATVVMGIGLSIFILPKLVKMFDSFNIALPVVTKIFLGIANFLVSYGIFLAVALVLILFVWRLLTRWPPTQLFFHKLYLSVPILKKIVANVNTARMLRMLSILLTSGVPIIESLEITAGAISNAVYRRILLEAIESIQRGQTLTSVLTDEKYFPKMANRMIDVGERTGKLDETLAYLSGFYETEVDNTTKNLTSVIEPILLIVIGVVLGFLAVAIISPIYRFTGSIQK
ncbi:MAG: type II secretion system F family protein [Patescibacteria group bacterium]